MVFLDFFFTELRERTSGMTVFTQDGSFDVDALVYLALALVVLCVWLRRRTLRATVWALIFCLYLKLLLTITLFPVQLGGVMSEELSALPLYAWVYLNPFEVMRVSGWWLGALLNIILTMPIGFMAPFVLDLTPRRALLLGVAVGLTIEGVQFVGTLLLRHPYREIDLVDLIANTIGVLLGYLLFQAGTRLMMRLEDAA